MFNSNISRKLQSGLAVAVLLGTSLTAQADVLPTSDIISAIEQNISAQTQEMMATAKRDFVLSVQAQLAEAMYEFDSSELADVNVANEQIAKVEE